MHEGFQLYIGILSYEKGLAAYRVKAIFNISHIMNCTGNKIWCIDFLIILSLFAPSL